MGGERKINNFDVNWLWTLFLTNTSGSYQFLWKPSWPVHFEAWTEAPEPANGSIMAMSTWWFVFLSSFEVLEVPRLWRFDKPHNSDAKPLCWRLLFRLYHGQHQGVRMACHQELSESGQKKCQNHNHHHQIEDEDYEDRQHLSFSLPAHLSAKPQGPGHGVPMTCHGVAWDAMTSHSFQDARLIVELVIRLVLHLMISLSSREEPQKFRFSTCKSADLELHGHPTSCVTPDPWTPCAPWTPRNQRGCSRGPSNPLRFDSHWNRQHGLLRRRPQLVDSKTDHRWMMDGYKSAG